MIILVIVGIFVLVIILFLLLPADKSKIPMFKINDLCKLRNYFFTLIEGHKSNSTMIISHEKTEKFIQFKGHIVNEKSFLFQFEFPHAEWCHKDFFSFKTLLDERKIAYMIKEYDDENNEDEVDYYLQLYPINNVEKAQEIAILAFKAMGFPTKDKYNLYYIGERREDGIKITLERLKREKKEKKEKEKTKKK